MRHWRTCEGTLPCLCRWLMRRHLAPAWLRRFVIRRCSEEWEAEITGRLLGAALRSGRPVLGQRDDDGRITVEEL